MKCSHTPVGGCGRNPTRALTVRLTPAASQLSSARSLRNSSSGSASPLEQDSTTAGARPDPYTYSPSESENGKPAPPNKGHGALPPSLVASFKSTHCAPLPSNCTAA